MKTEAQIQAEILKAVGQRSDAVVWRNNTGSLPVHTGRRVKYGLCVGSSDLIGILRPSGRFFAFEVKTATGKASREQDMFIDLVRTMGGIALVVRSAEDAMSALDAAQGVQ